MPGCGPVASGRVLGQDKPRGSRLRWDREACVSLQGCREALRGKSWLNIQHTNIKEQSTAPTFPCGRRKVHIEEIFQYYETREVY